jgi:hypothetical protein
MKLFPLVAAMFAQSFASEHVYYKYEKLMNDIKKNDFKLLDLIHHYTAGMKSVFT